MTIENLEFERDASLRMWEVHAFSNKLQNGFYFEQGEGNRCCLKITDRLVKHLYSMYLPPKQLKRDKS